MAVSSWSAKGNAGVLGDVTVTVDLSEEKVSHWPFGSRNRRSRFEPQQVALENANGEVLEELLQPRSSFKRHTFETTGVICSSHTSLLRDGPGLCEG
jgi:hypothetical protein